MSKFNPEKLTTEFLDGVTAVGAVIPRRYTLTHSDATGDLFLTIGIHYAWNKLNLMRDEVLGEWKTDGGSLYYCVYLQIDQEPYNQAVSARRNEVFRRELPLALEAIRYGDRALFARYPELDQAPILVNFMSVFPQFARQENWGNFHQFE
ncbi:staygreen family protein [Ornithinibacillus californiensis]|uniref:staygreen family protein n=1 Tax=Ornithinibacillus californiensis TaxID=161536 RepID=UPI00064DEA3B|nr:staygreen family protein [Ornithinibacillus californiensis]